MDRDSQAERLQAKRPGKIAAADKLNGARHSIEEKPIGVSLAAFLDSFQPPDFVVDQVIQKGYVHAMTGLTGHGKTSIVAILALCAASEDKRFAGLDTVHGNVIILCGENPEDFKPRLLAACAALGLDYRKLSPRITIIPIAFPLAAHIGKVRAEAERMGGVVMVIVDTSTAYYSYESEDDNIMARSHAQDLRTLTTFPGKPAVVVPCHPVKNATRDNLLPRGGSAFANEIDTNLTVWKEDETTTLHWHRKIRGPGFPPIAFELRTVEVDGFRYKNGNPVRTVLAVPLTEREAEQRNQKTDEDLCRVLRAMLDNPKASMAGWAIDCSWGGGKKWKVQDVLGKLMKEKLVRHAAGRYSLTAAGKSEAKRVD